MSPGCRCKFQGLTLGLYTLTMNRLFTWSFLWSEARYNLKQNQFKKGSQFLAAAWLTLWSIFLSAHPSTGIALDSKGNVYFSDLEHIWKHSASGTTQVFVKNVHSHHFKLSPGGQLVGEHSEIDSVTGAFIRRFWQASVTGERTDVSRQEATAVLGIPFAGEWYWPESDLHRKKVEFSRFQGEELEVNFTLELGNTDDELTSAKLGVFGGWAVQNDGTSLLAAGGLAKRINKNGQVESLFSGHFKYNDEHYSELSSVALGENGAAYWTHLDRRAVYISTDAKNIRELYKSGFWWKPAGVAEYSNHVYILESSRNPFSNAVRVIKLKDGGEVDVIAHNTSVN